MYRGRKGPFYSLSIGTYFDGGRQREIFCFLMARHTCKHKNVIAPHNFIPTDGLTDCSVVQYVPNRFIVTVNNVNV